MRQKETTPVNALEPMTARRRYAIPLLAAVTALIVGLDTGPAQAAWDECGTYNLSYQGAWTNAVPSHSSQHWVRYKVSSGGYFKMYDDDSGVQVAGGTGDGNWHTVYGLYNQNYAYQLRVYAIGSGSTTGYIDNCTSGCRNRGSYRVPPAYVAGDYIGCDYGPSLAAGNLPDSVARNDR